MITHPPCVRHHVGSPSPGLLALICPRRALLENCPGPRSACTVRRGYLSSGSVASEQMHSMLDFILFQLVKIQVRGARRTWVPHCTSVGAVRGEERESSRDDNTESCVSTFPKVSPRSSQWTMESQQNNGKPGVTHVRPGLATWGSWLHTQCYLTSSPAQGTGHWKCRTHRTFWSPSGGKVFSLHPSPSASPGPPGETVLLAFPA